MVSLQEKVSMIGELSMWEGERPKAVSADIQSGLNWDACIHISINTDLFLDSSQVPA
jgi:hypothetical protein